jgi:ribose 5-phosphate isomerase A
VSDAQQRPAAGAAPSADELTHWKRLAARAAVATVPEGAILGLGTGSTADLMLVELAERVRQGLRVTCVATSESTRRAAAALGLPLTGLDAVTELTMSVDGADEVCLPGLELIKGRGGALLYEKLVAAASRFRVIIVDQTKLVTTLGARHAVPVEVVPFGWRHTAARVAALGGQPALRLMPPTPTPDAPQPRPFVTDGGHYVLDCQFDSIPEPAALAERLKGVTGVVEHGLFVGMTERVFAAGPDGVRIYELSA